MLEANNAVREFLTTEKIPNNRSQKMKGMYKIDIIDYDKKIIKGIKSQNLSIPHPKMHKRNFVLLPLFEIAKSWIHPVKKKGIKKLLNSLNSKNLRTIKLI